MTPTQDNAPPPEFSRPFNTERLTQDSREERIKANEAELAALAKRFGILGLESLSATITLSRMPDQQAVIMVEGHLSANVTQACVVTLEPVPEKVEEDFETLFAPPAYVERWLKEHPEDDLDAPEPLDRGYIDLGEIVAQYLALALNPYPRKEGLEYLGDEEAPVTPPSEKQNPFAVLSILKDRK